MSFCIDCGIDLKEEKFVPRCLDCKKEFAKLGEGISTHIIDKVYLPDYGYESVKRIKELERRVVLNRDDRNGTYDVGRMGENGKIQERNPNY